MDITTFLINKDSEIVLSRNLIELVYRKTESVIMNKMLEQIVQTLILLSRKGYPYYPYNAETPIDFVMNKWNSVWIDGVEYALKLEKRG